jgi:flavorubredoxin
MVNGVTTMPTILILYNTKTGNTELMAKAVEEGAKAVSGVNVNLQYHASTEELDAADGVIFGVPTYNHNMTVDIQRLLEDAAKKSVTLDGKPVGGFGSFGWSGEAPRQVVEIAVNKFHMRHIEPLVLAKYKPDNNSLTSCKELGKKIAEAVL